MPEQTHSACRAGLPEGWVLYAAHTRPERLVAFVHGFRGGAVRTWRQFPTTAHTDAWWQASDLIFVGYDSIRENISGVATRLRRELPKFFPSIRDDQLRTLLTFREDGEAVEYQDLVLVGHSLGGLILRRALADCAQAWLQELSDDPEAPRPDLLRASVRFFSPASAGFRSAGALGVLQASPGWAGLNMLLRRSSAFTDVQPTSPVLQRTRERTERLVRSHPDRFRALQPQILWANPDNVVNTERYETDPVDDAMDGKSHSSVCKPKGEYGEPLRFVRDGGLQ